MPLSRRTVHALLPRPTFALALALALALGGCIENMGDLKEALGVVPAEPPAPVYAAPLAKAEAAAASATAGVPLRFVAEGSKDPQGFPLLYAWDFGEGGRASGAIVHHAFAAPGSYLVRLVVTSAVGLSDEDTLAIPVVAPDLAPSVALRAPEGGAMGEALSFEAVASDPEGAPLLYAWDFGDGATSHDARATHAYERPGAYDVRVRVTDAGGQHATASARVLVDGAWSWEGAFVPAGAEPGKMSFPVVAGAKAVEAVLTFEEGLLNDIEIVLVDAEGNEVARSDGGLGGAPERRALVEEPAPGAWSARVVKDSGVSVAWTLAIVERL